MSRLWMSMWSPPAFPAGSPALPRSPQHTVQLRRHEVCAACRLWMRDSQWRPALRLLIPHALWGCREAQVKQQKDFACCKKLYSQELAGIVDVEVVTLGTGWTWCMSAAPQSLRLQVRGRQ